MSKHKKEYYPNFSVLRFIVVFLMLIPLDLYRFWLRDHLPFGGYLFNWWGNVFDSTLISTIMTFITLLLINIKFKDKPTLKFSRIFTAIAFSSLANFFSETPIGQRFIISNVASYLKNVSDPMDFVIGVVLSVPLVLIIVRLKVKIPPPEVDFELNLDK